MLCDQCTVENIETRKVFFGSVYDSKNNVTYSRRRMLNAEWIYG